MFYILHTESGLSYYAIFALRAPILHVIKLEKKTHGSRWLTCGIFVLKYVLTFLDHLPLE